MDRLSILVELQIPFPSFLHFRGLSVHFRGALLLPLYFRGPLVQFHGALLSSLWQPKLTILWRFADPSNEHDVGKVIRTLRREQTPR